MPRTWIEPSLFLEYKGKRIYHAYKCGDANHVMQFHYNTDPLEQDDGFIFDIRNLGIGDMVDLRYDAGHKSILRTAIDQGKILFPKED